MDRGGLKEEEREALEARLGYRFARPDELQIALTHRSATAYRREHNERLEFLGDAVVQLVVSDILFEAWPEADEGQLSRRRASLVNSQSLAIRATSLGLGEFLLLGRGEEKTGGRDKTSFLAGVFEAVIGAVYRDGGYGPAREVVVGCFAGEIDKPLEEASNEGLGDFKTRLQELTQKVHRTVPSYSILSETGPDHARAFESRVMLGDRVLGTGTGPRKKFAEQAAARAALGVLAEEGAVEDEDGDGGAAK
jgi:ribonuclease-3